MCRVPTNLCMRFDDDFSFRVLLFGVIMGLFYDTASVYEHTQPPKLYTHTHISVIMFGCMFNITLTSRHTQHTHTITHERVRVADDFRRTAECFYISRADARVFRVCFFNTPLVYKCRIGVYYTHTHIHTCVLRLRIG